MPPTCWKNDRLLEAAPIWVTGTLFWTTIANTENIGPMPSPTRNIHGEQDRQRRVGAELGEQRRARRATRTSAPNISSR